MGWWQALFYIFIGVGVINILHFGFYLIGADIYDIWRVRRKQKLRHIYQPWVTVVVPAHNEAKVITRCLRSIHASDYPRVQVIVVDDASSDATRSLARSYSSQHPEFDMRLRWLRVNGGKAAALNHALRRGVKGELVMTLDADSVVAPDAISKAVTYFEDPRVVGVAANVRIIDELTILGLLQRLEHMVGYRSKKAHSITNCECIVGGVASTYRFDTLKHVGFYDTDTLTEDIGLSMKVIAEGNRAHRLVYAADVVAMTEGVDHFLALVRQRYRWKYGHLQNVVKQRQLIFRADRRYSRSLTFYRLPMTILGEVLLMCEPLALLYAVHASAVMHSTNIIIAAYAVVTGYLLCTIWPDEHLTLRDRMRLTLYAPVAYLIFFIMNTVQLIAAVRCLSRIMHIMRGTEGGSRWLSPRRIGKKEVVVG